jgi:hypothetical protein
MFDKESGYDLPNTGFHWVMRLTLERSIYSSCTHLLVIQVDTQKITNLQTSCN